MIPLASFMPWLAKSLALFTTVGGFSRSNFPQLLTKVLSVLKPTLNPLNSAFTTSG